MLESHGRPLFDGQKTRKTATYALETGRYSALIGNDEGPIGGVMSMGVTSKMEKDGKGRYNKQLVEESTSFPDVDFLGSVQHCGFSEELVSTIFVARSPVFGTEWEVCPKEAVSNARKVTATDSTCMILEWSLLTIYPSG